jgi:hypothetical protein
MQPEPGSPVLAVLKQAAAVAVARGPVVAPAVA